MYRISDRDLLKEPTKRFLNSVLVAPGLTYIGSFSASAGRKLGILEIFVSSGEGFILRLRRSLIDPADFYCARSSGGRGGGQIVYDPQGYEPGSECAVWVESGEGGNIETNISYQER